MTLYRVCASWCKSYTQWHSSFASISNFFQKIFKINIHLTTLYSHTTVVAGIVIFSEFKSSIIFYPSVVVSYGGILRFIFYTLSSLSKPLIVSENLMNAFYLLRRYFAQQESGIPLYICGLTIYSVYNFCYNFRICVSIRGSGKVAKKNSSVYHYNILNLMSDFCLHCLPVNLHDSL